MSYEVYIDVRHHPRHLDEFERRVGTALKLSEPEGYDPSHAERMRAVSGALEGLAFDLNPDVTCDVCGARRLDHHGYGEEPRALRCDGNAYGRQAHFTEGDADA